MPSRSAVYAQARKHAEVEKSVFAALTKRAAEERDALLKRRKAEDTLPIELWLRILSLLDDCNLLWSSCRQVSKSFRHCVDTIFRDDHIRNAKTLITFDVGDEASNASPAYSEIQLVFDRFSTDGSRAFFTELADTTQDSELQKASTEQWKSIMKKDSADRCQDPPYTIAVRRFVNDTDIPQLEIDFEKRAVSFDWRAMYTCFFREEDWIEKQQALWVSWSNTFLSGGWPLLMRHQGSRQASIVKETTSGS